MRMGLTALNLTSKKTLLFLLRNSKSNAMSTKCSTSELLNREWMLPNPSSQIHKIKIGVSSKSSKMLFANDPFPNLSVKVGEVEEGKKGSSSSSFYVVRDDLLHPLVNGNKARKLDALLPLLQRHSATDVVTCGGCQSAHTAALAVSCAERGMLSHLLLRGEQPEVPTGYNLVSLMYGNVSYVARSEYAQREEMLIKYANMLANTDGFVISVDDILSNLDSCTYVLQQTEAEKALRRVVIVSEGAGDTVALLGIIRLVSYLSQVHVFGKMHQINLVVDAGTGTTAIGLALGALCLGLPWKITAVALADTIEKYKEKEKRLISDFTRIHKIGRTGQTTYRADDGLVHWVERILPRRFGKVLKGEIQLCREISQQTGILLDPIYTLAGWEQSVQLSLSESEKNTKVVMLHTGGTLGLFGLAQRYTTHFHTG